MKKPRGRILQFRVLKKIIRLDNFFETAGTLEKKIRLVVSTSIFNYTQRIMPSEIEAKFLVRGFSDLHQKLAYLGGTLKQSRHLMRRRIFDYPDLRLDANAAWVRVRDEGERVVMSYKQRRSETLGGMVEHETTVGDFDAACSILEQIGLTEKAYQENYRETWDFMGCEIALDEWPWIPSTVEIESDSEEAVVRASLALGFDWNEAIFDSTDGVYQRFFDVTRTEASTVRLTFDQKPMLFVERERPNTSTLSYEV